MRNINDNYSQFTCTDGYHYLMLGIVATDGVIDVCKDEKCFWFLDLIISHQHTLTPEQKVFQVWTLKRVINDSFVAVCTDGNENLLCEQSIEFSDINGDLLTLWLVSGVILLPSEY